MKRKLAYFAYGLRGKMHKNKCVKYRLYAPAITLSCDRLTG